MPLAVVYTTINGQIASENRGGTERDYMPDTLGSTAALLDSMQAKTDTWEYWPYGEVAARTGTNATPFTFVGTLGYFKDVFDELLYVRARHYQPNWVRWLTVDLLWPRQPAYQYASNSPAGFVDVSGLLVEVCVRPLDDPLPEKVGNAHWFFNTSGCGARGFESGGLMVGWCRNRGGRWLAGKCIGGYRVNCYELPISPSEEQCICKESQSLSGGGGDWSGGGTKFGDPTLGQYNWQTHNCQDFVQVILAHCLGWSLDWPEMWPHYPSVGGGNCRRKVIGPPRCPTRTSGGGGASW